VWTLGGLAAAGIAQARIRSRGTRAGRRVCMRGRLAEG